MLPHRYGRELAAGWGGLGGSIDLFEETESRGYRYRPGQALEVWFEVMLRAGQTGFERGYKGILAYLHEARCTDAFLVNDGGSARDQRLLGYAIEIS